MVRQVFVHDATLAIRAGTDPGAPGAAVTTALCGHWEHVPPCRWPHNNRLIEGPDTSRLRTIFACALEDEAMVRGKVDAGLRGAEEWSVLDVSPGILDDSERALAMRLADGPFAL